MKNSKTFRAIALTVALILLFVALVPSTVAFVMTVTDPLINIFHPTVTEPETTEPIEPPVTTEPPESTTEPGIGTLYGHIDVSVMLSHPFGDDYKLPEGLTFELEADFGLAQVGREIRIGEETVTVGADGKVTFTVKPGVELRIGLIPAGNDVTVTLKNPAGSGFSAKDGKDSVNVIILPHEAHRADFINVYTPTGFSFGSFVSLNGLKVLEGRDWQEGDSFEFLLEMQNADGETWKEIGRASVTYNPNDPEFDPETFAEFHFASALASLQFSAAGTYTLRLSEVIGTLDNMAYDETVHYIDVVVGDSDMNGAYELQHLVLPETAVFVFDEATGRYEVKFIFNNSYTATDIPNSVKVSIGVRNDILNDTNGVLNPADFEFLMKLLESGAEIVQKTDANGKTVFTLEFSASDIGKTYTYTLSQVTGNIDNVEYSAKVYRISITIGVDENNQLTAAVVIDNVPQTTELIEVVFETIYDPESYWWHILLVPVVVKAVALPVAVVVRNKNQKEEE